MVLFHSLNILRLQEMMFSKLKNANTMFKRSTKINQSKLKPIINKINEASSDGFYSINVTIQMTREETDSFVKFFSHYGYKVEFKNFIYQKNEYVYSISWC